MRSNPASRTAFARGCGGSVRARTRIPEGVARSLAARRSLTSNPKMGVPTGDCVTAVRPAHQEVYSQEAASPFIPASASPAMMMTRSREFCPAVHPREPPELPWFAMEPRVNISRSAGSTLREIANPRNDKMTLFCAEAVDACKSLWKEMENWYRRAEVIMHCIPISMACEHLPFRWSSPPCFGLPSWWMGVELFPS